MDACRREMEGFITSDGCWTDVDLIGLSGGEREPTLRVRNTRLAKYSENALTLSPPPAVHSFTVSSLQTPFFKGRFPFPPFTYHIRSSVVFPGLPALPFRPRQTFSPRQTRAGTSCTANEFVLSFRFTNSNSLSNAPSARALI